MLLGSETVWPEKLNLEAFVVYVKGKILKPTIDRIEKDGDKLIFLPIIIYVVVFSGYTCYMHYIFKTYAWDLGILDQSLWSTLNSGKILYSTLEVPYGNPSGNFLGVHFSPILFLILPFYAIFQSPQTLLVFQSFVLAIAALPLYWLARDKLNKVYGFAFALVYLLNPALHGVNTFDFHLEIFTPVFVLLIFHYLEKGKWGKAFVFIFLEFMTIEFAPFIIFPIGLYFLIRKIRQYRHAVQGRLFSLKQYIAPLAIIILSIVFLFVALYTIAAINPLKTGGPYRTWGFWGNTVAEALTNIVRNPTNVVVVLLTPIEKPYFLLLLFSSVLFLPLLAPLELTLAFPWLAAALITDYQPYYQPYFQYSALVLGQIFIAAVFGFNRFFSGRDNVQNWHNAQTKMMALIVVFAVLLFVVTSPIGIPTFTNRSIRPYAISIGNDLNHVSALHTVIGRIPSNASIATIQDIFPHVCQNLHAYFLKWPLDYQVDYVVADVKSPTFNWGIYGLTPDQIVPKLLESGEYGLFMSSDGVLVLKRSYSGALEYYSPQVDIFNYEQLIVASGKTVWDYSSVSKRVIVSDSLNPSGVIWFGPYKYFVPGNYSVTFRLKTVFGGSQLVLQVTSEKGSNLISQRMINDGESKGPYEWQDFSLPFEISEITKLEFRGLSMSNQTNVTLDYVKVLQVSP